MTIVTYAIHSQ